MADSRTQALAAVLVRHSTRVQPGDAVALTGPAAAEPLLLALYEEVLRAGGHPVVQVALPGLADLLFEHANEDQLQWISPTQRWPIEEADVRIVVDAPTNTRELSWVAPDRQRMVQLAGKQLMGTMMQRSAAGELRWCVTMLPTPMLAAEANTSLRKFEQMYYDACLVTSDDPIAAWKQAAEQTTRLSDWVQGREEVHIEGPGTDLTLSIAGRTFIPATGTHNMPDGEFFTGPVEDSAQGEVTFHLPAIHGGRAVEGVWLRFDAGKVVDARADSNEEYLFAQLDADPGARFLGELGIGTNFGIQAGTRSILLDEKIGGTIHLAVGQSYPETGGVNESAVHWDMICDLRRGGSVTVDGELLQENGAFVV